MRLFLVASTGLLVLTALGAEPAVPADDAASLKVVKYPELTRTVRDLQGKVVVVDFWADWCINCKREFPHLVEMQKKYAKDGLVAVSVTVDKADDEEAVGRARKFLRSAHADFTNLLLDEPDSVWGEKLSAKTIPLIFVFGRDGRLAGKFDGEDANYEKKIEPFVADLLNK